MFRSSDYPHHHGWDTTSHEYYAHVAKMEKIPSDLTDVPRYPNAHMIFNNKVTYEEEVVPSHHQHHKHHVPEVQKVQFAEYEKITEVDRNGRCEVYEETVDVEVDGFIQQEHKKFGLRNWETFKGR